MITPQFALLSTAVIVTVPFDPLSYSCLSGGQTDPSLVTPDQTQRVLPRHADILAHFDL